MSRTSAIVHAPKTRFVQVYADYLALCEGDDCAAALLHEFEQWHNFKLRRAEEAVSDATAARVAGEPPPEPPDEWVYWSRDEMQLQVFDMWGGNKIDSAIKLLVDKGYIMARRNPRYRFDRTLQYHFNAEAVQAALASVDSSAFESLLLSLRAVETKPSKGIEISKQYLKNPIPKNPIPKNTKASGASAPGGGGKPIQTELEKVAANPYVQAYLGQFPNDNRRPVLAKAWLETAKKMAEGGYTPAQVAATTRIKLDDIAAGRRKNKAYYFSWVLNDLPWYVMEHAKVPAAAQQDENVSPERLAELKAQIERAQAALPTLGRGGA